MFAITGIFHGSDVIQESNYYFLHTTPVGYTVIIDINLREAILKNILNKVLFPNMMYTLTFN